jgi:hypothetical protein
MWGEHHIDGRDEILFEAPEKACMYRKGRKVTCGVGDFPVCPGLLQF